MFGIKVSPQEIELPALTTALSTVHVIPFKPLDGLTIATTEEEAKQESKSTTTTTSSSSSSSLVDIDGQCDKILRGLPHVNSLGTFVMKPVSFEKDDDSHMRYVHTYVSSICILYPCVYFPYSSLLMLYYNYRISIINYGSYSYQYNSTYIHTYCSIRFLSHFLSFFLSF